MPNGILRVGISTRQKGYTLTRKWESGAHRMGLKKAPICPEHEQIYCIWARTKHLEFREEREPWEAVPSISRDTWIESNPLPHAPKGGAGGSFSLLTFSRSGWVRAATETDCHQAAATDTKKNALLQRQTQSDCAWLLPHSPRYLNWEN